MGRKESNQTGFLYIEYHMIVNNFHGQRNKVVMLVAKTHYMVKFFIRKNINNIIIDMVPLYILQRYTFTHRQSYHYFYIF